MLSRLMLAVSFVVACASLADAQQHPKVEVFGGYSYMSADSANAGHASLNGFGVSAAVNATRFFGLEIEGSGTYARGRDTNVVGAIPGQSVPVVTDTDVHTLMAGPKVAWRGDRLTVFGHLLGGVLDRKDTVRFNGSSGSSFGFRDSAFGFTLGGGLDVRLTDRISLRAIQADLVNSKVYTLDSRSPRNLRLSTGIVFTFGK